MNKMEPWQSPRCLLLTKDRYSKENRTMTGQNSISRNCHNSGVCIRSVVSSTLTPDQLLSEHVVSCKRQSISTSTNFGCFDHSDSQWHCSLDLHTLCRSKSFIYQMPAKQGTHLHRLILHTFLALVILLSLANPVQSYKSTDHTTAQSLSKSSPNVKDIFYLGDSWMIEEINAEESSSLHIKPRLRISEPLAYVGRLFKTTIQVEETRYDEYEMQYKATEAGRKHLPSWMHLDSLTGNLLGVPLTQHTGKVYLSVDAHITTKGGETEYLNEVFSIQVIDRESNTYAVNPLQTPANLMSGCNQRCQFPSSCLPSETPFIANVLFVTDFENLKPLHRANLFLAVSDLAGVCNNQIWLNNIDWSSSFGNKLWSQLSVADFQTVLRHATILSFVIDCKAGENAKDLLELADSVEMMENMLSICGNGIALDEDAYVMVDCYQWFIYSQEKVVTQSKHSYEETSYSRVKRLEQEPGDYGIYEDIPVSTPSPSHTSSLTVASGTMEVSSSPVASTFSVQSQASSAVQTPSSAVTSSSVEISVGTANSFLLMQFSTPAIATTSAEASTSAIDTAMSTEVTIASSSSIQSSSQVVSTAAMSLQPSTAQSTPMVLPSARVVPSSEAFTFFPGQAQSTSSVITSSSTAAIVTSVDFVEALTTVPQFMISSVIDFESFSTFMQVIVTPTMSRAFSFSINPSIEDPDSTSIPSASPSITPFSSLPSITPSASLSPSISLSSSASSSIAASSTSLVASTSSASVPGSSVVVPTSTVMISSPPPPPTFTSSTPMSPTPAFSTVAFTSERSSTTPVPTPTPSPSSPTATTQVPSSPIVTTSIEPSITFIPPTSSMFDLVPTLEFSSTPMPTMPTTLVSTAVPSPTFPTATQVQSSSVILSTIRDESSITFIPPTSSMVEPFPTLHPSSIPMTPAQSRSLLMPMPTSELSMSISMFTPSDFSTSISLTLSIFPPAPSVTSISSETIFPPTSTFIPMSSLVSLSSMASSSVPTLSSSSVLAPSMSDIFEPPMTSSVPVVIISPTMSSQRSSAVPTSISTPLLSLSSSVPTSSPPLFPTPSPDMTMVFTETSDILLPETTPPFTSTTSFTDPTSTSVFPTPTVSSIGTTPMPSLTMVFTETSSILLPETTPLLTSTTSSMEIAPTPSLTMVFTETSEILLLETTLLLTSTTSSVKMASTPSLTMIFSETSEILLPESTPLFSSTNFVGATPSITGILSTTTASVDVTSAFTSTISSVDAPTPSLTMVFTETSDILLPETTPFFTSTPSLTRTTSIVPSVDTPTPSFTLSPSTTIVATTSLVPTPSFSSSTLSSAMTSSAIISPTPSIITSILPSTTPSATVSPSLTLDTETIHPPLTMTTDTRTPFSPTPVFTSSVRPTLPSSPTPTPTPDFGICDLIDCRNGTCMDLGGEDFTCLCYTGWTGLFCDIDVDYCSQDSPLDFESPGDLGSSSGFEPGPCDSLGTERCVDGNSTYTCICLPGFTGRNCTTDIDECLAEPCLNNATCINEPPGIFTCECTNDYTGPFCEIDLNPCSPNPCLPNQECIDLGNGIFDCENITTSTPVIMSTSTSSMIPTTSLVFMPTPSPNISICDLVNCGNGTCIDLGSDNFRCECFVGWTGESCDIDIDYCADGPCFVNGTLDCMDGNSTYTCECILGYTGQNCSVDIDECESEPCMNNGTCVNSLFGFFSCECTHNFTGPLCEIDLIPCSRTPNLCQENETCISNENGTFTCVPIPPMTTTIAPSSSIASINTSRMPDSSPPISSTVMPSSSITDFESFSTSIQVEPTMTRTFSFSNNPSIDEPDSTMIASSTPFLPPVTPTPTLTPTPIPVNTDPVLLNPIGTLLTNEGQLFQFAIPDNTFYDQESGATNQLRLSLLDSSGNQLSNTTWIQLRYLTDSISVIEGIPLREQVLFGSVTEYVFLLRAEDRSGGVAYDFVTVQVIPTSEPITNFLVVFLGGVTFEAFNQNLTAKVELYIALSSQGADGNTDVYIRSFSSGSIAVSFTNLTVANADCPEFLEWVETIFVNFQYTESFISTVLPFIPVNIARVEGPCSVVTVDPPTFITPQSPGQVNPAPQSDLLLLLATVVPAAILACCCLLCGILAFLCYRRRRTEREDLTPEGKMIFLHRRPIVLEGELDLPLRGRYPMILANEPAIRFEDEHREAPRRRLLLEEVDYYDEESGSEGEEVLVAPLLPQSRRERFSPQPDDLPPEYELPPVYEYARF